MNYARCPSCRGVNSYLSKATVLFKKLLRGEGDLDDLKKYKKGKWTLPDGISLQLSCAFLFYRMKWVF